MSRVNCEGWWEQPGYGRQPMERLQLSFDEQEVSGSGFDIVGLFEFSGRIENGNVALVKKYLDKHCVDYVGTIDGEGTLHGTWHIDGWQGPWLIKIVSHADLPDVQEQTARFYGDQ